MKGLYLRRKVWWYNFTPAPYAARVRVSTGEEDEVEAIKVARRLQEEAGREVRALAGGCDLEIAGYLASLKKQRLSKSTMDLRAQVLQNFVTWHEVAAPQLVKAAEVQRWFDQRWRKHPETAVKYLSVVRWWYEWLMDGGKVPANPATDIEIPKMPMRQRRDFLRPVQARKVIDACTDDNTLKFALYCGLHAGLRKLEVVEAVPAWFDLEEGLIHLDTTGPTFAPKDRDTRTVPMTKEFQTWLKRVYLKGRPDWKSEPFMMMPKVEHGKHRYRWEFRKPFVAHMEKLGLERFTFHDLRRTFASLLVSKGVSIYKVAKWLGDAVKVVEETYGHLIPKDDDIDASWVGTRGKRKG